ncbi:MAG: LysE family transporter, partial [Paracoccaceae bacterium]|nr:LysE family transporter [Paracoccaceae bacterium]
AQYADRLSFALGSMSASVVFFFTLGFGARRLAPLFARPAAWRLLDAGVGLLMWIIAAALIRGT